MRGWAQWLERRPLGELGAVARRRLDGLERARGAPGKDGPEPRMSPRDDSRKRRREERRPAACAAPLATFLGAAGGKMPPPRPVPIRR